MGSSMKEIKTHEKIHVLYIITKLELGGAQKVCLSLFHGLAPDIETFLVSGSEGLLTTNIKDHEHVSLFPTFVRELSLKPSSWWREIKNFYLLTSHIRTLKKQYPNLIVHTHSTKAGILGRWAAFFAGVGYRVHTIHGFGFHENQNFVSWFAVYIPELMTSFITTHFICVSMADIEQGKQLFPRFARKHSLIRAAVDWQKFYIPATQAISFPKGNFIFGTVSCFKPQKNLFDLLQAFARVHYKNQKTYLELIGDGPQRPAIEAWIQENHLSDFVTLHGWQEKVTPIMKHWHAFVMSSLWEGLPCAVVEARLLKLPVISYNTGGIHEVVINGYNGFLYQQKRWESLADGMLNVASHDWLYTQFQQYPDHLEAFQNEAMITQHKTLYEQLIQQ
jgi:glycosyltransferase involved in cell wall biosynthesis